MRFSQVIGHNSVQELLREMVDTDRFPHALLLLGAPGSGVLPMALATAAYLLCENRTGLDSCGQCKACLKTAKAVHPDLHFSFPTVGAKVTADQFLPPWREALAETPYMEVNDWLQRIGAENRQGNINKDECNQIIRKLSLKTFEGQYKVMLIWLPEYLGNEGNRLLKLIEEPPPRTVFLLAAEQAERILNTILSRCQLVKLGTLDDEAISTSLQHQGIDRDQANTISFLANGNYNDALQMAQQREGDQADRFLEWMRCCYTGKPTELVAWTDGFAPLGREHQKHFLRYGLHFWREFLTLQLGGSQPARLRPPELATAQRMQSVIQFDQLEGIIELMEDCIRHIERNAHPKILFLDASIRMHQILKHSAVPDRRARRPV